MIAIHEKINFNLRPAKRIERSMIAEVLMQIARYENLSRYAYVGMGSYYFADFILMHRLLGIDKMISIEREVQDKARFHFNRPFGCVEIAFGTTHEKLPTLKVFDERPVIAWLDYYGYLDDAKLGDIELVATKCKPGSALLVTVDAATPATKDEKLEKFTRGLSETNLPADYSPQMLQSDERFAELSRAVMTMRLESAVAGRNAGTRQKVSVQQIFNFRYRDGAAMATYGWLFLTPQQMAHLKRSPKLLMGDVVARGKRAVNIEAPRLTFKEIAYLKALLPESAKPAKFGSSTKFLPESTTKKFAKIYRYFPSFAHIEE